MLIKNLAIDLCNRRDELIASSNGSYIPPERLVVYMTKGYHYEMMMETRDGMGFIKAFFQSEGLKLLGHPIHVLDSDENHPYFRILEV